uniref:ribonuclease III n=1 Tax=Diabrotica virgifera virgifera TaxID=50390 RepID=A0A6P7H6F8_DIAVI
MASYHNENVYTHTFTPKEYQVELLESAKIKNTIMCSSTSCAKAFILVKLLQEFSWQMRIKNGKKALFILDPQNVPIMTSHIKYLTDLNCISIMEYTLDAKENGILDYFEPYQVITSTAEICVEMLKQSIISDFSAFNLFVIDDCLYGPRQSLIEIIMKYYRSSPVFNRPRILGLTTGLLSSELQPDRLEGELRRLEKLLNSDVDTSSEIVTLIRLCCRPHETLIECPKNEPDSLYDEIKNIIKMAIEFLKDHRYDPSEIYEDDLLEELKQVPDPRTVPLELLEEFLEILKDLGPWGADKAALNILSKIEKLKVKIPYERHYLLLCMVSSALVTVRAVCDYVFESYDELERINKFSSPKVLKFIDVLKQFKPPGEKPQPSQLIKDKEETSPVKIKCRGKGPRRPLFPRPQNEDNLCCLVFVHNRYKAKSLFALLCSLSNVHDDLWWISALFSVEKVADSRSEARQAENEHKTQEEVLRKFRCHECNILVSTSVLEQGCDLPKCNLVIRFDLPNTFYSYIQSKARARAPEAHYILFGNEQELDKFVDNLAEYNEVENTLLRRCYSLEPNKNEEMVADMYNNLCKPYQPLSEEGAPSITLINAISLLNKYCAKLPSDTFTRLTPIWSEDKTNDGKFICHLRLPINSPVKKTISSPPMPNGLLARRAAAFMICQLLHMTKELDDYLQPISKENFRATEDDWVNFALDESDDETSEVRPGTTKRRQYYYKRISEALLNCHPVAGQPTFFYKIMMTLTCPLPEEQNTRGRKIYPPEDSLQGFGILTSKRIPKISAFPIFTRSGEVSVDLELISTDVVLSESQIEKTREFVNYTFTSVLRLQKYLMLFNPEASPNNYLIVPTIKDDAQSVRVHWDFIDLIFNNLTTTPEFIVDEKRVDYEFKAEAYSDAVVMPWYRNQDQPQYFYVAEICSNLNPTSAFPGSEYATFEEYYNRKYGIQIQNLNQNLLDVDHTSARLNFLTPRYVNRKGVALPTSSEETKRAKRENLEQKQILVPELCAIHPFPGSLWRKAVALPCILYRINALLLADQIRRTVAEALRLGKSNLSEDFKWPSLNFGWSLSDVLKKSREEELRKKQENLAALETKVTEKLQTLTIREIKSDEDPESIDDCSNDDTKLETYISDSNNEGESKWIEIGTWCNEMAGSTDPENSAVVRYASPTSWMAVDTNYEDFSDSESDMYDEDSDTELGPFRIEFTGDHQAEAVDDEEDEEDSSFKLYNDDSVWQIDEENELTENLKKEFHAACDKNKKHILSSGILIKRDSTFSKHSSRDKEGVTVFLNPIVNNIDLSGLYMTPIEQQMDDILELEYFNEYDKSEPLSFSFDKQPNLEEHPGPSPNVLLQALTMSNANDGINLERLETIGDSFLKYAITNYLYSKYENVHEGKLSHLRSKQVSNLNLYRLGRRKYLGEFMIATKFDPHDNWLPPCFYVPKQLEEALIDAQYPANCWSVADMAATRNMSLDDICLMVRERAEGYTLTSNLLSDGPMAIPYNLVTQHSIPDKSIADCVEAVIGAYLIECGPRGALLFMAWLGIRVLPRLPDDGYGEIKPPRSPLLRHVHDPEGELTRLLDGYDKFERHIGYKFADRSYLLQAMTHASYFPNHLTDCYQRLEFLGDAVLDYLITRHLYEDPRMHSPGALTDLRSALVNNTIFASLAVRNNFHKYFRHLSPGLNEVVERFIRLQEESGHSLVEELYLVVETECEEIEDVEVPKALGDVFESVAGAIFLDSGMSLDAVWKVYYKMMKPEIEQFSNKVPKSPIRELLELEPETAKFGKPEKLADGRRVRVTVEVFGKGLFKGIGRNYRIAKCTAAKCALKHLKRRGLLRKVEN